MLSAQMDRVRLDRLNDEIQQKEELLQEERMEREKAEVELGREKDCNRVSVTTCYTHLLLTFSARSQVIDKP